jgi:hypothetical protein
MPRLACRSCGRQIYTTAPLEALFAEERRCPRCGAFLDSERREIERRLMIRRQNPIDDPGPPTGDERRLQERRKQQRRRGSNGSPRRDRSSPGWID